MFEKWEEEETTYIKLWRVMNRAVDDGRIKGLVQEGKKIEEEGIAVDNGDND